MKTRSALQAKGDNKLQFWHSVLPCLQRLKSQELDFPLKYVLISKCRKSLSHQAQRASLSSGPCLGQPQPTEPSASNTSSTSCTPPHPPAPAKEGIRDAADL